jgi:hypothetical protein
VVEAYSFWRQGLPQVRKAATVFGVTLLLSIGLVTAGRVMLSRARPVTAAAQQKQTDAQERLVQAQTERDEIRDFQPKFEQLRARGMFGAENRLVMIEAIRDIQRAHNLLPINYEFAPQQVVALDPVLLGPPLELHSSTVILHMSLLHEMDLINFLNDLKAKGFYTVKDCLVTALDPGELNPRFPRLSADCTLYWLTVGEAAPAEPAPAL